MVINHNLKSKNKFPGIEYYISNQFFCLYIYQTIIYQTIFQLFHECIQDLNEKSRK